MTKKQKPKSMGEVLYEFVFSKTVPSGPNGRKSFWQNAAQAVIREHEKRKKQKVVKRGKK